ncbi:keratin, type II cytoskeletal 2 epidermal-like [Penaeus monodon]|uniref:keratin, type II cytoskeletal 2 epidermal-like n=1 Tax=Penaeus monodon TaxID=6687 RepID=UPI0018A7A7EE|nr:keratin, type II cytoskeletal 2 epidermal-like [Penaeus monodon]
MNRLCLAVCFLLLADGALSQQAAGGGGRGGRGGRQNRFFGGGLGSGTGALVSGLVNTGANFLNQLAFQGAGGRPGFGGNFGNRPGGFGTTGFGGSNFGNRPGGFGGSNFGTGFGGNNFGTGFGGNNFGNRPGFGGNNFGNRPGFGGNNFGNRPGGFGGRPTGFGGNQFFTGK